jgi:oxygen-independent coproporphyrinogen-3 oxidase
VRHVYVHVPFCVRRCSYCDFSIAVRKTIPSERFVSAILSEQALRIQQGDWDDGETETLYFGGGTPSLLPPAHLAALIDRLRDGTPEITVEANPDDVKPEIAQQWRAAGITRVSLGVQSFNARVLNWMHRTHDVDASRNAVDALRNAGIENISLDLIFGLPEELEPDFERDLTEAVALDPTHLSIYGLSVEERTPLSRWISRGVTSQPSDDRYAREFLMADRILMGAGFEHYEVSNYARPGYRSRHNSAYWLERPYAGLGPAAHSFRDVERRWNAEAWSEYDSRISQGTDPVAEREILTPEQQRIERVYLGLRTSNGLARENWSPPGERERIWTEAGWLFHNGDRFYLTPEGWLRLDEIAAVLTTSG